jgi:hypothetical protein
MTRADAYGYVRRFARTGEPWHVVPVPPTADGWRDRTPALCGRTGAHGMPWGTICSGAPWMRVCGHCRRALQRRFEPTGRPPRQPQGPPEP